MKIQLPEPVDAVIDRLRIHGYDAYAVGGCIRDTLLGNKPKDWDVTTVARPEQVVACFGDQRVVKTGIAHGTVTVIIRGEPIEVTTYRVDGNYTDHRRPDTVSFAESLHMDMARRDFTINAIAFRPDTGIVDPFGGQADLLAGVIRCVGDPRERINEDALRILRALRFASRFGFSIDEETARAMLDACQTLSFVAVERVLAELCGMCFGRIPARFLPVFQAVIPELAAIVVPAHVPNETVLQFAALLRGLDTNAILSRLRAANALRDRVTLLANEMEKPAPADDVAVRRLLNRIGPEATAQLCRLQGNDTARAAVERVLARGDCYSLRMLCVGGDDLREIGIRGKALGEALRLALDRVIDGELPNEKEPILRFLYEHAGFDSRSCP
ncbi:MAG: tRNA nucleotidyltransferase [Clostridia bacterium]|nr:tRNA nucleotidyltransferase [Clostridia bacterium]